MATVKVELEFTVPVGTTTEQVKAFLHEQVAFCTLDNGVSSKEKQAIAEHLDIHGAGDFTINNIKKSKYAIFTEEDED
jgi:hypothetical protein